MKHALACGALLLMTIAFAGCGDSSSTTLLAKGQTPPFPGAYYLEDEAACPPPQCFEASIPVPESVSITDSRVRIIVPADYGQSGRAWPVLYLLHDAPGDFRSWTERGQAHATLKDLPVIAVMPDGGGGAPGWYSDWEDGSFQWQSYHMEVLLPYVEQHLQVAGKGARAIAGPSMGGYGAMHYSASYPGRFKAAAGFSGAVDFLHLDRASALYALLAGFTGVTPGPAIWGDPLTNYARWQQQDPGTRVEQLLGTRIFLTSGNGLPGGPHDNLPAGAPEYAIEPFLLLMNQSFANTLTAAGVPVETLFYGPGYHNWPYYRDGFAWALPGLLRAMGIE